MSHFKAAFVSRDCFTSLYQTCLIIILFDKKYKRGKFLMQTSLTSLLRHLMEIDITNEIIDKYFHINFCECDLTAIIILDTIINMYYSLA